MSVSSIISLFSFCLDDMSIHENGILKSAAFDMWGSMCDLSFNDRSFGNVGTFACVALRHHPQFFFLRRIGIIFPHLFS